MIRNSMLKDLKKRRKKGFSLVELVVVMAIIGILLMVMAPNYAGFIEEAKGVGVKSDARTLQTMVELVRVETAVADTVTIGELPTAGMDNDSTAVKNLTDFVTDLKAKSAGWSDITIGELPSVISGETVISDPEVTP